MIQAWAIKSPGGEIRIRTIDDGSEDNAWERFIDAADNGCSDKEDAKVKGWQCVEIEIQEDVKELERTKLEIYNLKNLIEHERTMRKAAENMNEKFLRPIRWEASPRELKPEDIDSKIEKGEIKVFAVRKYVDDLMRAQSRDDRILEIIKQEMALEFARFTINEIGIEHEHDLKTMCLRYSLIAYIGKRIKKS